MQANKTILFEEIVGTLESHIAALRAGGETEAAFVLGIAKLDVQMRLGQISGHELSTLCATLDRKPRRTLRAVPPRIVLVDGDREGADRRAGTQASARGAAERGKQHAAAISRRLRPGRVRRSPPM